MRGMKLGTKKVVVVGIFSAIAFMLQMLGSIIGLKVGGFLEIEFSDLPALIISMAYGPLVGVLIELVKNLLHCAVTTTGFVGEFANFAVNGIFCFVAGSIYKRHKTFKTAIISLLLGVIAMVVGGLFTNLFVMLPLYMPQAEFSAKLSLVLGLIVPFNAVRGLVLVLITSLLYKRISRVIK